MSFPASLTTRVVKGRFVTYPAGKAAKGTVRFVLDNFMQGPTDNVIVIPFDVTFPLDNNGAFSAVLPATNDPQWTPAVYKVTVTVDTKFLIENDIRQDVYQKVFRDRIEVPYNETDPLDLADVLNIPSPTPGGSYILAASKGVAGGVASLDAEGKVPQDQLPAGIGGTVLWDDILDKPTVFPPRAILHVQSAPSTSWGIVHSFGREPSVDIVIDGESVMADIKYPTETTVVINFGQPQIGKAILT